MGAYISDGIDQGKDKSIYPHIPKINTSMRVQDSSSLTQGNEYCFIILQLFYFASVMTSMCSGIKG